MSAITFCGHRDVPEQEIIRAWLSKTVEGLIRKGADRFYLGGYGRFDALAAAVVREQKERHPEIRSVLVLPSFDRECVHGLFSLGSVHLFKTASLLTGNSK